MPKESIDRAGMITMKNITIKLLTAALFLGTIFCGCTSGDKPVADTDSGAAEISALLASGKQKLADGLHYQAEADFREVIAKYDAENGQAYFGAAMARGLYLVDFIISGVSLVLQLKTSSLSEAEDEPTAAESLINLVDNDMQELEKNLVQIEADLMAAITRDPEFVFDINEILFYIFMLPAADISGEYTVREAKLFNAVVEAIHGSLVFVRSQTLTINVYSLLDAFEAPEGPALAGLLATVADILDSNQDFLKLREEEGSARFAEAAELLKKSATDFSDAIKQYGEQSSSDLENPVLALVYDTDEERNTIYFNGIIDSDLLPEQMNDLLDLLVQIPSEEPVLEDYSYKETLELQIYEDSIEALDAIAANLSGSSERISLNRHLLPLLSDMAYLLIQMLPLGDSIGDILPMDLLSQDLLRSVLKGFLPDVMELDLAAFLATSVGIRDLLPAWDEESILVEWECADELIDDGYPDGTFSLVCSQNEPADGWTDEAHFVDSTYEIAADGFYVSAPIFAFPDPTFNGLLYLDVAPFDFPTVDDPVGFEPADSVSIGLFLAGMVDIIGGLF
jgi:hypothetical protein